MDFLLNHLFVVVATVVVVTAIMSFILNSSVNVGGAQIVVLERKWFGRQMPDGRTVALPGEVGVQARILGPGFHILVPFLYKTSKHDMLTIPKDNMGLVRAITGANTVGSLMAHPVECNLFQDGEAFLKNGGQKGPQLTVLPEGQHWINPYLFQVQVVPVTVIGEDEVGCVEAMDGKPITRPGGNFGSPVDCNSFQDGEAFLKRGGQKGPQVDFLKPGTWRVNTNLFKVYKYPIVEIPGGKMGLVEAMDGARVPEGRLLGRQVQGHGSFTDGQAFITNGGEKGRQIEVLMPGRYYINSALFNVRDIVPIISVLSDQVGVVTVQEGSPILESGRIAADELGLDVHDNFQNPSKFLAARGQKGLQIPVLRAGNYAINPWFATVDLMPMLQIDIGFCGVVTSYVGEEGADTSDNNVNAKTVIPTHKGIWDEPMGPGKHPLNPKICKVDVVPTTQILLNWADNQSSAHEFDSNLSTITLRTADAFDVSMDVSVIIHIPMANAPKVVANLGSVKNMITQVLEPAISSHFRNAAQYIKALDLYSKRKELQETAKAHIAAVLQEYHIESKDTLIADVVLPSALTKTVTDRQLAEQERQTYTVQKQAQEERRQLENAKAQAEMQPEVVKSERQVEIEENRASSVVKKAEGENKARILNAEADARSMELSARGQAEATKLNADAEATATKVKAAATAESTQKIGKAEAEVILAKGQSTAEAYKLEVNAMGQEVFGQIQVVERLAKSNIRFMPDNLIIGGGAAGSNVENMMGLALMEKLGARLGKVEESAAAKAE